ncbi:hypothetical protein LOK49_LG01G02613 [Camellia lanceoleosa]|uniref:Uncharacterized protein n=1 Tax=Camellia lanceoleosa TaxID=1840588 RepID=A0ACC0J207_9ERIC|nr:hypothetical protein LOK49_LG01G02613 [Camellia lanceoleosa]
MKENRVEGLGIELIMYKRKRKRKSKRKRKVEGFENRSSKSKMNNEQAKRESRTTITTTTPFIQLGQVDSDFALALSLQEQERAFTMLPTVESDTEENEEGIASKEEDDQNEDDFDEDDAAFFLSQDIDDARVDIQSPFTDIAGKKRKANQKVPTKTKLHLDESDSSLDTKEDKFNQSLNLLGKLLGLNFEASATAIEFDKLERFRLLVDLVNDSSNRIYIEVMNRLEQYKERYSRLRKAKRKKKVGLKTWLVEKRLIRLTVLLALCLFTIMNILNG